jgi:prolipoprotein diacylglyceryl transferase
VLVTAVTFLASIPSPSSGVLDVGIEIRAYGLMIGLGVLAAVWLTGKCLPERGISEDHAANLAMWAVPAGLVGARLYHVITDWKSFRGRWIEAFYLWQGGLGILGGIALGAVGAYFVMRRNRLDPLSVMDAVAPALPLAQAIGRWGNYWNQELYGRPTDLPWGLEIDERHRVPGYTDRATFHPTFLYESIWNLALAGFLIWIDRKKVLKPGRVFGLYVAGYSLGRLWIEAMRIDTASKVAGLRVNLWVFGVVFLLSAVYVLTGLKRSDDSGEPIDSGKDVDRGGDHADDETGRDDDGDNDGDERGAEDGDDDESITEVEAATTE